MIQDKEAILKALYAAASDPGEHEEFIDEFDRLLQQGQPSELGSWLEPHIQTATHIFEKLNFAGVLEKSSAKFVDSLAGPAAILTISGEIVASNTEWSVMTSADHIKDAVTADSDWVRIRETMQSLHAILENRTKVLKLDSLSSDCPVLSFRRLPVGNGRDSNGGSILVRALGISWPQLLTVFLKEQFELTDIEMQTLQFIVAGKSLSDIATEIGRSRETVKSHTKLIYAKLDASGREDVVRLVLQLHNLVASGTKQVEAETALASEGEYLHLEDGRRLYWVSKGAKDGRRILFLHGLSLGHQFSPDFERHLSRNNLQLICLERPGYGRSDPPRNWKRGLEEWIDLFPELNRKLGLGRGPIVTQTGGVMLATAAAALHPKLVSGICAFAAGIPIIDRQKLADYPAQIRLVSRAARLSPNILRFLMMNAARYFRTPEGQERLIDRTYANGTTDAVAVRDPVIREGIKEGMELMGDGRLDGFVSDNLHMFGDWSRFPKQAKCEIAYLNGSDDQICPIEWSREFAETVPNMSVAEAEGAGNLMLHTHPEACMSHLLSCLERFDKK